MKAFSKRQLDLIIETAVSVMWTKKEVLNFLEECNVSESVVSKLQFQGIEELTKRQILRTVFEELSMQPDKGTPQFKLMAAQLVNWQSFNPRHFAPFGNLDIDQAERSINALRQALGLPANTHDRVTDQKVGQEVIKPNFNQLPDILNEFVDLANLGSGTLTPQARGLRFESLLNSLFLFCGIPSEGPFRVNGMQIDGAFKFDNHHYLLEAKWTHSSESAESLLFFSQKVGANMDGRGLFISINGFTDPSILALTAAQIRDVILMDGQDVFAILEERITLSHCLEEKIRAAQTRGALYFNPVTKQPKSRLIVNQYRSS